MEALWMVVLQVVELVKQLVQPACAGLVLQTLLGCAKLLVSCACAQPVLWMLALHVHSLATWVQKHPVELVGQVEHCCAL